MPIPISLEAVKALSQIVPIIANSWLLQWRNEEKGKEAVEDLKWTIRDSLSTEFLTLRGQQERLFHRTVELQNDLISAQRKSALDAVVESKWLDAFPLTVPRDAIFQFDRKNAIPLAVILGPMPKMFRDENYSDLSRFFRKWFPLDIPDGRRIQFLGKSWKAGWEGIDPHVHTLFNQLRDHPTLVLQLEVVGGSLALIVAHWTSGSIAPSVEVLQVTGDLTAAASTTEITTLIKIVAAGAADAHFFQSGLTPRLPTLLPALIPGSTAELKEGLQNSLASLEKAFPAWSAELGVFFALGLIEAGVRDLAREYLFLSLKGWAEMRKIECSGADCLALVLARAKTSDYRYLKLLDQALAGIGEDEMLRQMRASRHAYAGSNWQRPQNGIDVWRE